jgi:hypothetical protein
MPKRFTSLSTDILTSRIRVWLPQEVACGLSDDDFTSSLLLGINMRKELWSRPPHGDVVIK